MRGLICLFLLGSTAFAQGAPLRSLRDVEVVDARGYVTRLTGFRRVTGDDHFRGYRGASRILVPYDKLRELHILTPPDRSARLRAKRPITRSSPRTPASRV